MKAKTLIKILEQHPEANIRMTVTDSYSSRYGVDASLSECNPDTDSIWTGYMYNSDMNHITISVGLDDGDEGKHPKITYRK